MELTAEHVVSHAAPQVFETVRDRQPELVPYMPSIAKCELIEREETPPAVRVVNRWQAKLDEIPRLIRSVISPDLISWLDRATWNDETLTCTWELEPIRAKDIFSCHGKTTISPQGEGSCLFAIHGQLRIFAEKIPGVPRLLAGRLRDPLERFIAGSIRPNLTGVASAVQQYLDARK